MSIWCCYHRGEGEEKNGGVARRAPHPCPIPHAFDSSKGPNVRGRGTEGGKCVSHPHLMHGVDPQDSQMWQGVGDEAELLAKIESDFKNKL